MFIWKKGQLNSGFIFAILLFEMLLFTALLILLSVPTIKATEKCVWISGFVHCKHDPDKQVGIQISLIDRDGHGVFQQIDKDDLMSWVFTCLYLLFVLFYRIFRVTVSDEGGAFHLSGCAKDINWLFFHNNHPDPYLKIKHSCNRYQTTTFSIKIPKVFVPETYDIGMIDLDTERQVLSVEEEMGSGQQLN